MGWASKLICAPQMCEVAVCSSVVSRAHLHQVRELGRGAKQLREAHGLPDRVADLDRHIFLDIARSPVLGALLSLSFAFFAHLRLGFAVLVDGHGRRPVWKKQWRAENDREASFRAIRQAEWRRDGHQFSVHAVHS